jgi:hypothetical protein
VDSLINICCNGKSNDGASSTTKNIQSGMAKKTTKLPLTQTAANKMVRAKTMAKMSNSTPTTSSLNAATQGVSLVKIW